MPYKITYKKARVRNFVRNSKRYDSSQLSEKLESCPTLACIAGNIPPKKISDWKFTDQFYHARFKEIRLCLNELIDHGAYLAAHGQEDQLPALRDFVCGLATFWPEHPDRDDPIKAEQHYGALFDQAVSEAQRSGEAPELSEEQKQNILIGLEDYIIDLASQFDQIGQEALDSGLWACESIAASLRQEWKELRQAQAQESIQPPGQMLI